MCLHIFAPGRKVQIDYAAETVTIVDGGREAVFDLLVTNHSPQPIERLHLLYPHPLPLKARSRAEFSDQTSTFFETNNDFNQFYTADDASSIAVSGRQATESTITVSMADPMDIVKTLDYKGTVSGHATVLAYSPREDVRLTRREWTCLSDLGWSAMTLKFDNPLATARPRWMRLVARTGRERANDMIRVERFVRWMINQLSDDFEIVGPLDIRYRLVNALKAASLRQQTSPAAGVSLLDLHSLSEKLLTQGVEHPETETIVEDWRLNVFQRHYRRLDPPSPWGDLLPCGGLKNRVRSRRGGEQECYQWKAGRRNILSPQTAHYFGVRMTAHKAALLGILLPWIALVIALFALITRPDVLEVLALKWQWFKGYLNSIWGSLV